MSKKWTEWDEGFSAGVNAALAVVYDSGEDTLAEEIVRNCGSTNLWGVARRNEDPWVPKIRATIREIQRKRRLVTSAR